MPTRAIFCPLSKFNFFFLQENIDPQVVPFHSVTFERFSLTKHYFIYNKKQEITTKAIYNYCTHEQLNANHLL